jgi:PST family polysaccharide transporter
MQLIRKAFFVVGLVSLCVSVVTAVWAAPVCHLILGKSFDPSILVLRCLSPLPLLFGLSSVFGTQTMLVFEMDALFSKVMLISAVLALPLTVVLTVWFGAIGAAAGTVATAVFIVAAMLFALHSKGMHIWERPKPQPSLLAETSFAGND